MDTAEVVDCVVHAHGEMQARLQEWEAALEQLTASDFSTSQRGLQRVWRLVPFFNKEVPRHFHDEETRLFPVLARRDPAHQNALARFQREHQEFRRQWREFMLELLYSDAVGETRRVYELSASMIRLLREHIQREEQELLPLLEKS